MRPIQLAVVFDQHISVGGGYQQSLNAALLTRDLPDDLVEVSYFTTLKENVYTLSTYGINATLINLSIAGKIWSEIRAKVHNRFLHTLLCLDRFPSPFEKVLLNHKIELVYFLSPCKWARYLEKLNFITTVWDLCHLDAPEFPEVRWKNELQLRETNYNSLLNRANAIFVDSEYGKQNLSFRYCIPLNRVHVLPFQPAFSIRSGACVTNANPVNIHEKYSLSSPYVFYPAQFWAHKNHVYLIEGLLALEESYGQKVGAIFSGGDQGTRSYIEEYVIKMGLQDRVRFVGFVPDHELLELYLQSIALVMPTYFGPTNLPPLEAFHLGVPVLYPDLDGLRDQVDDAALLMDLSDPESMALHLSNLLSDSDLRNKLVAAGFRRAAYFDSFDRIGLLKKIISDFRYRRLCWK